MEPPAFLHALHQVRTAEGLRLASWLAIGLVAGGLLISWRRLLGWFRTPETRPPALVRWGKDDRGWFFELADGGSMVWVAEASDGSVSLAPDGAGLLRPAAPLVAQPAALVSDSGIRLRL
ncbi:MAG: hypothetical protein IT301_16305 [Dehalococcoidia bacterium]|nr:hypothetical protein [Dehalococcoidia bacterium]